MVCGVPIHPTQFFVTGSTKMLRKLLLIAVGFLGFWVAQNALAQVGAPGPTWMKVIEVAGIPHTFEFWVGSDKSVQVRISKLCAQTKPEQDILELTLNDRRWKHLPCSDEKSRYTDAQIIDLIKKVRPIPHNVPEVLKSQVNTFINPVQTHTKKRERMEKKKPVVLNCTGYASCA